MQQTAHRQHRPALHPWLALYAGLGTLDVLLAATLRHDPPHAALFAAGLAALGLSAQATARYWPRLMRVELRVLCGLASLLLLHLLLTS